MTEHQDPTAPADARVVEPREPLVAYAHPGGLHLRVPRGWERSADPGSGVVLVAVEPRRPTAGRRGFRANLVVAVDELLTGLDLDAWQAGIGAMLPSSLHEYRLVALERLDLGGMPAIRRLAQHRSNGGSAVTMEQWTTIAGAVDTGRDLHPVYGWSLTTSIATPAYAGSAGMFAEVARSWRPPGHAAGPVASRWPAKA